MREILFRGQTRRKGEKVWMDGSPVESNWVYGGVLKGNGDHSIIYQTEPDIEKKVVYTDTLGQFTGLTDKNGTKIFEGDIITFEDVCCEGGSGYEYPDEWAVEAMNRAEIIIWNGCVCFGKELFESTVYEDIQSYYPNLNEWFAECTEVIGNIYDNPELIGGEQNE